MRIKLTANSNVSLPAHLSNIDLSYGYTLVQDDSPALDKFQVKLASSIDKALSFFKPLTIEQKDIITTVTESAKFLNEHISQSDEHLDNLRIQLNFKTPLNQGMQLVAKAIDKLGMPFMANPIFQMVDSKLGMILPDQKKMFLGEEIFNDDFPGGFVHSLKNDIGLAKTVKFVVYHESAHAFEFTNVKNVGNKFDIVFNEIYENTKVIAANDSLRNDLNNTIKNNSESGFSPVDKHYSMEIASLFREIYADVSGLLLLRNQDITESNHSRENDLLNINSVISARNIEQSFVNTNNSSNHYINTFNHFTSPGLDYLKDHCYQIPNRVLSQEEIHTFAHKAIEQGISRVLIANSVANKDNIDDLTTLFSIRRNTSDNGAVSVEIPMTANPNIYVEYMNELKKFAGEEWVKNFTRDIYIIHDQKIVDNKRATWHAAFYPKKFKEDLANNSTIKALMDDLFGPSEEIKNSISEINLPSKEAVGLKVENLIDKFRKPQPTNTNSTKPNFH
jgi:hypothetical protein